MKTNPEKGTSFNYSPFYLAVAYVVALVYGTLFPMSGWHTPALNPFELMMQKGLANSPKSDILTNVLVYLPLGIFLMRALPPRYKPVFVIVVVTLLTSLLSLALEICQAYLPGRVPSISDWIMNTCGGCVGALLALSLRPETTLGHRLIHIRSLYFLPGPMANFGLLIIGLWALAQLSPLVPSLDLGNLRQGLKPLGSTLIAPGTMEWLRVAEYFTGIAAIGFVSLTISRIRYHALLRFAGFAGLVLLLKIPVIGRQLSLEAVIGLLSALTIIAFFQRYGLRQKLLLSSIALISAVVAAGLYVPIPAVSETLQIHAFNWVPFRSHLNNDIVGIIDILGGLWPFLALSYFAILATGPHRLLIAQAGAILVFLMVFALEWHQQSIPGRSADVTDAIIAMLAWLLPWFYKPSPRKQKTAAMDTAIPVTHGGKRQLHQRLISSVLLVIITLVGINWLLSSTTLERPLDESSLPLLPAPSELPEAHMPNFNYSHPRLPAPSSIDIARIQQENPRYLKIRKKQTGEGKGNLEAAILTTYVEPGSVDIEALHKRLMELEISWRGHKQAKPVAVAYDWLYDQWSAEQRAGLRNKLVDNANYLIHRIREEQRLSPYNVFLYNSPFQALMATSLALYGDDRRGDEIMNYTHDYWKNRVLPVWRQIMGTNGGWHEGGEYVGIGIGQAVYQLPAMWRKATGEDLFRTEPGLRGFLDFLIYRTRPDKTHFRWGDGSHFDRLIPDRIPLAIEYRHAAAYSLNGCPRRIVPTSWPWGPLPDDSLCDPDSISRLPLARYFDGIGMLVARSDWTPDATYVSFKAGDNYWSHTHLDQGSFTVFQNGALVIDSGAYGGGGHYGSDHHMNYAYQTIAHNTVTVHDPDDTVAAPRDEEPPRQIANDGGQRRIGSGWGIEAAPLDLNEWMQKRDIYHTGTMEKVFIEDELVIAVADLTPAYTNIESGKGTFSHRTRRVEQFIRTFGFDQDTGAILIFDRVRASNPDFRKRWLHHSIGKPELTRHGYTVKTTLKDQATRQGTSRLDVHVLLPRNPDIALVGGPGSEFHVDGRNYDEDGKTLQSVRKKRVPVEAGNWRIELSPSTQAKDDLFMVVLLPHKTPELPPYQVRLLEKDSRIGCEIVSSGKTTRWWFDSSHHGPMVEVISGNGRQRVHDVRVAADNSEAADNR
jgi:VanZ family protein